MDATKGILRPAIKQPLVDKIHNEGIAVGAFGASHSPPFMRQMVRNLRGLGPKNKMFEIAAPCLFFGFGLIAQSDVTQQHRLKARPGPVRQPPIIG
jgi:hypothetical protein